MRVLALVEAMRDGDPAGWIDVAAAILARAHLLDDVDALLALECLTHAAAEPGLPYTARQQLYEAAVARGQPAIARLFLAASPTTPLPATLEKQLQPERPLRPQGRPLTLGERKSAARTHRRDQILLMRRDPHPAVVAILLDNPHVTESDVMFMASMRPHVPESLAVIAGHPRWSVRHPIKRALVLNPSTPLADAIRIATTLRGAELAELATDPAVPEVLRTHAAELRAATLRRPRA
ncbi:MAG: hypothetical protein KF773_41470 [Deltaproteobacteria bacterium]|nr:hypothetical protein [Deltaproteobacteria bacterium]